MTKRFLQSDSQCKLRPQFTEWLLLLVRIQRLTLAPGHHLPAPTWTWQLGEINQINSYRPQSKNIWKVVLSSWIHQASLSRKVIALCCSKSFTESTDVCSISSTEELQCLLPHYCTSYTFFALTYKIQSRREMIIAQCKLTEKSTWLLLCYSSYWRAEF